MKKSALYLLPAALLSLAFAGNIYASDSAITAIPPRLELNVNPGQTTTFNLKVRNETESTQTYSIKVDDFIVIDNVGTPFPISANSNNRYSLANWLKAPAEIPVDAKKTQEIKVTLTVPTNAHAGGHYAMITYMPNGSFSPTDLQKTGSLIGQRTGTIIYVTVAGPITQSAAIRSFKTSKFNEQGPIVFDGLIANLGDVHVDARGTIKISDWLGQTKADLPVETGNIFPEASRSFAANWNQKWGYGQYRADLVLSYGAGSALNATIFFWLFPIRLVIYSLILLISILVAIILLTSRRKEHEKLLEQEVKALQREIEDLEKKV